VRKFVVESATMAQKSLAGVADASHNVGPVMLCGHAEVVEQVRSALLGAGAGVAAGVEAYAVRPLRPDDRERLGRAAVVVYGGEVTDRVDDQTRADLAVVGRIASPLLVVLEGAEMPMDASVEAARVRGVEPGSILAARRGHFPDRAVLRRIAARSGASGPGLAGRVPALRPYVIERVIETSARRNGMLAAAAFRPRADMPLLTSTNMRMVLQIGVCHGVEVGVDRAVELIGVLGAGLGLRSTARGLVGSVPLAGWVVKGGVAYSGTRALGRSAVEYFEHGTVADVDHLRTLAEQLRS
jgi:uncharacterized protein (DUF697 family)